MKKRILTIAGSDSGGGAGIQIDTKTSWDIGCDSSTVITAITAQNYSEVRSVEQLSLEIIEGQFRAVMDEIQVDAIKIGMLGSSKVAELIAKLLDEYQPKIVVLDPVLIATSGGVLGDESTKLAILEHLVPRCTVLTPNIDEAEKLCEMAEGTIMSQQDCDSVWERLNKRYGLKALLLKGGHAARWQGDDTIIDMLYQEQSGRVDFMSKRLNVENWRTHGTGCTLSTALASYLALSENQNLADSAEQGILYVQNKIGQE